MALQYRPKDTERDEAKLHVINRIILSGAAMYLLIDSQHIFSGLKHLFLSSWLLFYDKRWWRKATWCDEAWVCTHHLGESWLERWLSECSQALCSLPPLAKLWPSIRAAWPFVTMFMIKDHHKSCTSLLSQYTRMVFLCCTQIARQCSCCSCCIISAERVTNLQTSMTHSYRDGLHILFM